MEMRVGTTGREALLPNSRGTYLATVRGGREHYGKTVVSGGGHRDKNA